MNLLSAPLAGFAACPNGWVELYIRGSSTRATWYASFEGDSPNSTGSNITLDAYGAAEIYVNQLVDVVVKQSDGTLYRQYTDGYSSPNVEVRSASFLGTDYNTAAVAAGNPTTLQAVLDKWVVSAGAVDWQVNSRGTTDISLLQLAGALGGFIVNVQSPQFGATGDGTTDDTTAILNALAEATTVHAGNVGSTVFFPKGDYVISSVITWDYRVNIVMVPGSTLTNNSATNATTLKFTSANSTNYETIIFGLGFKAAQSNTGVSLSLEASQKLTLINCSFGGSALDTGTQINVASANAKLTLHRCRFSINGSTQSAIGRTSGYVAALKLVDCEFVLPAAYTGTAVALTSFSTAYGLNVDRCLFDGNTNTTVGAYMCIRPGGNCTSATLTNSVLIGAGSYGLFFEGTSANVTGNYFSGLTTALEFDGVTAAMASGNRFNSVTNRYGVASTLPAGSYLELDKYESIVSNTTTPTFGANTEFTQFVSNTTVPTCTMSNGYYAGQLKRLLHKNTSGGNWVSVAFAGAAVSRVTSLAALDVNAGAMKLTSWIWTDETTPGTYHWLKYAEA